MQKTRRTFQAGFLALTLVGVFVLAGNAERWCPFGGVEALHTYLSEGTMTCSLAVSNFYVLAGLLLVVLLLRRAFCSYICPIGTLTEWTGKLGPVLGIGPVQVPQKVDRLLSLLKYGVLALILYVTWNADELLFRTADPCYALISRHGEDITVWAYVVSAAILLGGLVTAVPFCRWLCPLAAVMSPFSRFGLMRIKHSEDVCIDCGQCSEACPMNIPVHHRKEVNVARCTTCMTCISVCPVAGEGGLTWGLPGNVGRPWPQATVVGILLAAMIVVVSASYAFPLPSFFKERGTAPAVTHALDLEVQGVACRGSSNLLWYFLSRDDFFEVPGYLKLETWPEPGTARVRIFYDPEKTDPGSIKEALITPYHDEHQDLERESPFTIEGYAPWDSGGT